MMEIMHQMNINYSDLQTYRNLFIGNIKNQFHSEKIIKRF